MYKMKGSGVEWIGDIPEDWRICRIAQLFSENKQKNTNYEFEHAFKFKYGTLEAKNESGDVADLKETYLVYTIVEKDDIVINCLNLNYDFISQRVAITPYRGIITSAYLILNPRNGTNSNYYTYLFKAMDNMKLFHGMGRGVRLTLTYSDLKNQLVVVPPIPVQRRIINYLDEKCAKIDAIIEKQQIVIDKLKAYKLSVITEAVTKGLNPDAEMKDSGVEWIGEIPRHWQIHKFCWDYSAMLGKMLDAKRVTGMCLHPYIKNADVQWNGINVTDLDEMDFEDSEVERYTVKPGDLMICEGGEIGKCSVVPDDFPAGVYYQKALHRVRKRHRDSGNIRFLSKVIFSMAKNECLSTSPEKATIAHLPGDALSQLRIPSPPVDEQEQIANYLESKCKMIESMIEKKLADIDKLTEYKKSLIYEVITGKKEV